MTKIYFTQEQIIDLYKQGVGIANIGKYLNCSYAPYLIRIPYYNYDKLHEQFLLHEILKGGDVKDVV